MVISKKVVVLGSVHMDLVATAARLPGVGESVAGGVFSKSPGGKAGYQAVQFAKAGADVEVLSRLGDDDFGRELRRGLAAQGVGVSLIATDNAHSTGASTIFAADGDYQSIIAPGAAALLSTADLEHARSSIEAADALVLQLELPVDISERAAGVAKAAGRAVILNVSPVPESVPNELVSLASIIVVNRVEAGRLLGKDFADADLAPLAIRLGVRTLIVTLGAGGSMAWHEGLIVRQPAFKVAIADTTVGAGDSFLAATSVGLLEGLPIDKALARGAAAGAITVSRPGGYDALPARDEIDRFLADAPYT